MPIIASRGSGTEFTPHPEGQYPAVCVDVHDLGILEVRYQDTVKRVHKIDIHFYAGERKDDEARTPLLARSRFTLSLHPQSRLRPFLENWRGKRFTTEEEQGFDVEKLVGVGAVINIQHVERDGQVYANVIGIMRLPKGMEAPEVPADYVRFCDRDDAANGRRDPFQPDDDDLPF